MIDSDAPAVDLDSLMEALRIAEDEHQQHISFRGCACGVVYESRDPWAEARGHVREMLALAAARALSRRCETCSGTGTWRKMRGNLLCPDCDGRGRTTASLPALMFEDHTGQVWVVDPFEIDGNGPMRVWARRYANGT